MSRESSAVGRILLTLMAMPFVWASSLANAQALNGDHVKTNQGGDLVIHPINHATFAMAWNTSTIYVDPVGGASAFSALPAPNLVLITDIHGDHLSADTLNATVLANGETKSIKGVSIEVVPMYNTTPERLQYHTKGRGNGYVVTLGGKRIYISGDTEDIPEMRALENIDVAFVCFNLPYTMTEEQAASAVRDFSPKIVYPYHYRGSDIAKFKKLVGNDAGIEVREGSWY
jgi:L-ascorbate metabolism protein UlaG (beta-lactamase superfamily)